MQRRDYRPSRSSSRRRSGSILILGEHPAHFGARTDDHASPSMASEIPVSAANVSSLMMLGVCPKNLANNGDEPDDSYVDGTRRTRRHSVRPIRV
jgi:hypothetical protein